MAIQTTRRSRGRRGREVLERGIGAKCGALGGLGGAVLRAASRGQRAWCGLHRTICIVHDDSVK